MHAAEFYLAPLLLSALPMLALAGVFLWLDHRRLVNQVFATFFTVRALSNAGYFTFAHDPLAAAIGGRSFIASNVALAFAGLSLAFAYPRPVGVRNGRWIPGWILGAVAIVLMAVTIVAPATYVRYTNTGGDFIFHGFGPLILIEGFQQAIFASVAAILVYRILYGDAGPNRQGVLLVAIGLVLYPVSVGVGAVISDIVAPADYANDPWLRANTVLYQATMYPVAAAFALFAILALRGKAGERKVGWWACLVMVAAALVAAGGSVFAPQIVVGDVNPVSVWYVAAELTKAALPVLVTYGIVRHQVVDVDLRVKGALRFAPLVTVAALVFVSVGLSIGAAFGAVGWLVGALAAGLVAVAARPLLRVGDRVAAAAMPNVDASPDYLAQRKLEVYRAALEESVARGSSQDTEERILSELRHSLGISDDVHRAMVLVLRSEGRRRKGELTSATRARFRIERELGRGGFGRVVLAHDLGLDRKVVLKQPTGLFAHDESSRQLFLKEARLAGRIQHANVVAVHDVLEAEDPPMLVMEYVEGGSLDERLGSRGRLAPAEAARLASDVLAGLARIHAEGIVHRDIKPGNILLARDGMAKVTDFGIAHAGGGASMLVTVAGTGYQPGSLAYMSPEQARGDPVDARSDLYSLAVVLHQALAGRHYLGDLDSTDYRARTRIQTETPDLSAVPEAWRRPLSHALAKDPNGRYASAAEMSAALEAAVVGAAPRGPAAGASPA